MTTRRLVWFEALKGMPTLSAEEWRAINPLTRALVQKP